MTTEAPHLVGIGAVFIDDIVLPSGQTYMAQLGGGVVHALMGAVVWGERPGIIAPVGQGLPAEARDRLQVQLDTRGLYELAIPQIRAWQLFEEDGTRRELYRVRETVPFTVGAQPEHLPACFSHAQGYYLLQGFDGIRRWRPVLPGLVLWEPLQQVMVPGSRAQLRDVLQSCKIDVISPNLAETQMVYGDLPLDDLIDALFEDGAQRIALRMGALGSLVACRETGERHHVDAVHLSSIVDQTGAGNAYCGGLLWGLLAGKRLREAAAAGAVSASFCLEQVGVLKPDALSVTERDRRYLEILAP
jgi:sugar/nucleoside kinase (ribokinase family)